MPVANRIRKARTEAGLTQEQLAERLGTSKQSVSNAERGAWAPTLEWLHGAALALGCKPSALDPRLTDSISV